VATFLLEIGTEELPADFVRTALPQLEALVDRDLAELHLSHGTVRSLGTPRRLAIQVEQLSERQEDRVEEAPGLQRNSRLSCQCEIEGDGPIVVRIPAWNRNAVKEVPH